MLPVYILPSIRRYHADGGLYLANLDDAISWFLLVVPVS
jgi:hypothetical protein